LIHDVIREDRGVVQPVPAYPPAHASFKAGAERVAQHVHELAR
jgi:hypothetical protein